MEKFVALLTLTLIISIWDSVWKAISLWKSARNGHLVWFVCLLIFNTAGILPILYIFMFSEKVEEKSPKEVVREKKKSPKKKKVSTKKK